MFDDFCRLSMIGMFFFPSWKSPRFLGLPQAIPSPGKVLFFVSYGYV
jgi:hypothetical protein